jgi:hypothetical protein
MKLKDLPTDILGYIVEYINPDCAQERVGFICDTIVPCIPYLIPFFCKKKTDCGFDDHIHLNGHTVCINQIERLDVDEKIHRIYFHCILKQIVTELQSNNSSSKYSCYPPGYCYHFPNNLILSEKHSLVQVIIHEIMKYSQYKYSHMCCGGKGFFAKSIC